jgi:FkbM family methyltransferase
MKTKLLNILRLIFIFKPFETILTYFTSGSIFGSFLSKIPPNHYQYKTPVSRKVKRNGINYKLDISDIIDWYIYYGFRELSKELLLANIKENDTVIDVGANVGEISLRAANIVGNKKGKVYSFEPDHVNFNRFLNNMRINAVKNITPINKGLGNVAGSFSLSVVNENNRGMNRIIESNDSLNTSKIEVITLDNYIKLKNITRVDLIKIDT